MNYVDALVKFHNQNGKEIRLPYVDKKPLDLYKLKKAVENRGGFDKVCKSKKWAEIGRDLGYSGKIMSSLSTSLKNSYQKFLCPYEEYLRAARPGVHQQLELEYGGPLTPSPAPSPMKKSNINTPASARAGSPTRQASDALQATVNGKSTTTKDSVNSTKSAPSPASQPASGFTSINSGGFKAVNSGGFTSVNRTPLPTGDSTTSTPVKSLAGAASAKNTPEYRSSALGAANALKRQLSCDSLDSRNENGDSKEDADGNSRRSKRIKKGMLYFPFIFCHSPPFSLKECLHWAILGLHNRAGLVTQQQKPQLLVPAMVASDWHVFRLQCIHTGLNWAFTVWPFVSPFAETLMIARSAELVMN